MMDWKPHLLRNFQIAMVLSAAAILGACAEPTRVAGVADPFGYCYRTLGIVDCYTTPEINRNTIVPAPYRTN